MNLFNLLFVFTTFITICMTERCSYSNSVITCDDFSSVPGDYWFCDIFAGNNTDLIRDVIKNCTSEEYRHKTILNIYKYATFDVPLMVELDVGQNVTVIYFYFYYPGNIFQVRSTKIHPSVSRMTFIYEEFILPQSNFFEYFPNLNVASTIISRLLLNSLPSFQNNTNLTNLELSIKVGNGFTLDASLTLGLSSLTRLSLTDSGIQSITPDALDTVIGLTELILQNNQIQHLPARVFEKLTNLETLDLDNNLITSSSPDAFFGLDSLSRLSLSGNEYFPVNVLVPLSNLESLILTDNNYTTLNPFTFQQLSNLTFIDLTDNPLDCNCELQWMSYVANYGISVEGALCATPSSLMGSDATTPGIYSGCGSMEEFTCFNKSVTCPYNQVCQNIGQLQLCCCPEDHRMVATGNCVLDTQCRISNQTLSHNFNGCGCTQGYQRSPACTNCIDINECEIDNGVCEQNCENTIGSFLCSCNTDYVLHNITQCDVNECQDVGLMCNGICENTIGSYRCHCWQGFIQQNDSLCVDINECEIDNGVCEQNCENTIGSFLCSCNTGYVLHNVTQCDVNECQDVGLMCNGICENTIGSYRCHCWQGFIQQNDSLCVDIDECAMQNAGCEHLCHNTQGSYFCSCYEGFTFSSTDLHVCQSLNAQTIFSNPTVSITAIGIIFLLIVLLIIQTIVCAIFICCKKRKSGTDRHVSYSNPTVPGSTNVEPPYVEMSPVKTDSGAWKDRPNSIEIENPYYETVPTGNTLPRGDTIVYGEVEDSKSHYENQL